MTKSREFRSGGPRTLAASSERKRAHHRAFPEIIESDDFYVSDSRCNDTAGVFCSSTRADLLAMRSLKATLFLVLVASVTGVIVRGPSVLSDTYIRAGSSTTAPIINYATTNFNAQTSGWWDGPLTISATQVISGVTSETSALLIKFDLSSFVGATLVPNKRAWLNYYVSDTGNNASLRELVVPWNEVRRRPRRRAHTPHNRVQHPV